MAKQAGPFKITGCYDNTCFYKMDGVYYARRKSSLSGKRVKKDPAFRRTMEYAGLLGEASKIASALYRKLPAEKKEKGLYRKLTGEVMRLLKEGKTKEEIPALLIPVNQKPPVVKLSKKEIVQKKFPFAEEIIHRVFPGFYKEPGISTASLHREVRQKDFKQFKEIFSG